MQNKGGYLPIAYLGYCPSAHRQAIKDLLTLYIDRKSLIFNILLIQINLSQD